MRKSISTPSINASSQQNRLIPMRSPSSTSLSALGDSTPPPEPVNIEALAEAMSRTSLPNLGICTELYGFPNELVSRPDVKVKVSEYVSCLLQPLEPLEATNEEWFSQIMFPRTQSTSFYNPERMARWFRVERRKKRRWSFAV